MDSKRDPSDNLTNAIKANAPKLLEGGEYFGKMDFVVDSIAEHYDEPKEKVRERLKAAIDKLPKPKVDPELKAKKEAASKARAEAQEARNFANEAAVEAKKKEDLAATLEAEASGRIVVEVPASFSLNIGGTIHRIEKGTPTLPREHAEHPYAQAHGVRILGASTEQAKKA